MALDEWELIKSSGLERMKELNPKFTGGRFCSRIENWMVNIGENGNITPKWNPRQWRERDEEGYISHRKA